MSEVLEATVREALKEVRFRGLSRDIVSFGFVDSVEVDGEAVRVHLKIRTQDGAAAERTRVDAAAKLRQIDGLRETEVTLEVEPPSDPRKAGASAIAQDSSLIPGVRRVIAVASGKGGVGK